MFELSKQKSRGYWIILGIIIFAFISAVLRMALQDKPVTFNDELVAVANEINSHTPMILDSMTRFEGVSSLPGNVFQYHFTLITSDKADFDSLSFVRLAKQGFIEQMRNNPKREVFKQNQIIVKAVYSDSTGKYIGLVEARPADY